MAATTYLCRAGGYWLFSRIDPPPALRSVLSYVPGTLFVSFVVPSVVSGGLDEWTGAAATVAAAVILRSHVWPIFIGVGAAWVMWALV